MPCWQTKRLQSVCALQLRHRAIRAAQKDQQCLDALAALSAATTGGVNAARLGGAGGRGGLRHLAVGQGVAKADIHAVGSSLWRELQRLPGGSLLSLPVNAP